MFSFDDLLVDVLLELQGGLQLLDVADVQVTDQRVGAGAGDPALDSSELDVSEDNGRVEAGGRGRGQHPGGEAPHGQAGQRLQGQDRGAQGLTEDISAHGQRSAYSSYQFLSTQYLQCLAWTGLTLICGKFRLKVFGARNCLRSTAARQWRCPAGESSSDTSCSLTNWPM